MNRRKTDKIPNTLEALCEGVLPNIAERIKRAYWLGIAEASETLRKDNKEQLLNPVVSPEAQQMVDALNG